MHVSGVSRICSRGVPSLASHTYFTARARDVRNRNWRRAWKNTYVEGSPVSGSAGEGSSASGGAGEGSPVSGSAGYV